MTGMTHSKNDVPDTLFKAFLKVFWPRARWKKILFLGICGLSVFGFILWNSLPESIKQNILSHDAITIANIVIGTKELSSRIEIALYNGYSTEEMLKEITVKKIYLEPVFCMPIEASVFALHDEYKIIKQEKDKIEFVQEVSPQQGGLSGYNLTAHGHVSYGCGYSEAILSFPVSISLPSGKITYIYIDVPKKAKAVYTASRHKENIGKKKELILDFARGEYITTSVSAKTSKGDIHYENYK